MVGGHVWLRNHSCRAHIRERNRIDFYQQLDKSLVWVLGLQCTVAPSPLPAWRDGTLKAVDENFTKSVERLRECLDMMSEPV